MSRPSATVVLVHGAWHGAWCFAALQDALDQRGVPSYAIDLPGHGTSTAPLSDLHGDAAHVVAVLDRLAAPSVLVGHSYGGAVISHAAAGRTDVGHLVYLAAFALYGGESVMGFLAGQPRAEVALSAAMRPGADGCSVLDPVAAVPALYGDCDTAAVAAAVARLSPQPMSTMTQEVHGDALVTVRSTYVRCLRDAAVHPMHQATMAARCTASIDLDCDHSPFLSRTADIADLLAATAHEVAA